MAQCYAFLRQNGVKKQIITESTRHHFCINHSHLGDVGQDWRKKMRASDVMTTCVITAGPNATLREIAELLLEKRISAVPVVEGDRLLGIVSEHDLIRRPEFGTEAQRSWWLALFSRDTRAADFIKSHGLCAHHVMTREVVTVTPEADLAEVAATLEKHNIKRVPVVDGTAMVGIISRANLLVGLIKALRFPKVSHSDREIRSAVIAGFQEAGLECHLLSITVTDGVVRMAGPIRTLELKEAAQVAIENVAGIKGVEDDTVVSPDLAASASPVPDLEGYPWKEPSK